MKVGKTLASTTFVNVGYGTTVTYTGAPVYGETGTRRVSTSDYAELTKFWLGLQQNPRTGSGGICGGDSGGPHFVGDSSTVVAVTTWAGSCRAMSFHVRIDTPAVLAFLEGAIDDM